ncbi:hypothetical protein F2Q69_00044061 [Brassica cretica]|uniref:Uncharacterized protein n=1 Tax=Brassica cretica TaxID=69181 RepID=A0A8S9N7Q4_BRACR|nr:hypothetical protein F2Q69_00044061 [Brassica cretica]
MHVDQKRRRREEEPLAVKIVITEDTSFCWWKSPSPFPSILSVKILYYRTCDDVKTVTPSELEPSSPEFISLSRWRAWFTLLSW